MAEITTWRVYWRVKGENIGRGASFSHKEDAAGYLRGLRDCGWGASMWGPTEKCALVDIPAQE